jgi:threonine dehydrogenase-like Zn-dependent dehydrogenase
MKKPVIALITSLAAVGLLAGCSTASVPTARVATTQKTNTTDFFGAWSVIDATTNEPALNEAPASIAPDGSVELIFMFQNGDAPATFDAASGVVENSDIKFPLQCDDKVNVPNTLFACTTGRFVDPSEGTRYTGLISRVGSSSSPSIGTAIIKRGTVS